MSQMSSQEKALKQRRLKVKCMTFTYRAWTFQSKTCMKYCLKGPNNDQCDILIIFVLEVRMDDAS